MITQVDRLTDIIAEMRTLLGEAQDIIRNEAPQWLYERAKAYPLGHIDAALDHEGWTVNTYDITLQDIVNDLQDEIEPEEDEEDEEDEEEINGEESIDCPIHGATAGTSYCPRR